MFAVRLTMTKLVIANLMHRPVRSIISILAVGIEVVMILSIVGIFMGMLNDTKERTNGIGADLMMRPSGASIMNGISGAPMTIKLAPLLSKLPHVTVVSPAIVQFNTGSDFGVIDGIDYASFNRLKPLVFVQGGPFQGPDDAIIDDIFALTKNPATGAQWKVGDTLKTLNHNFRVSGIVEHGKGARKLLPIDTMGQLMGAEGKCSIFYIKVDDPANQQAVIDEIHATPGLADYPVMTMEEWLSEMTPEKLPGFNVALDTVTGIAVIVGFLVIFQSMYTAVLERTREIGILKSMGASKPAIVSVVLRECAALAAAGIVLGIAGVFVVRFLLLHLFPTQHFEITALWIGKGTLIAFVGAICGALYPAWMAVRKDPIEALAYE